VTATASATTAASVGKPKKLPELRRVSHRSPMYQMPESGPAAPWRRGCPVSSRSEGSSEGLQAGAASAGCEEWLWGVHDRGVGEVVGRLVEEAGFDEQFEGVATAVPGGRAADPAGCEDHPSAGLEQFLRDLVAGLGASHDEDSPGRQPAGSAVVRRVQLLDAGG
jgi:hypothetical protein